MSTHKHPTLTGEAALALLRENIGAVFHFEWTDNPDDDNSFVVLNVGPSHVRIAWPDSPANHQAWDEPIGLIKSVCFEATAADLLQCLVETDASMSRHLS